MKRQGFFVDDIKLKNCRNKFYYNDLAACCCFMIGQTVRKFHAFFIWFPLCLKREKGNNGP